MSATRPQTAPQRRQVSDWEKAIEILGTSTDQANKRKLHSAASSAVEMLIGDLLHVSISKCLLMGWHISNVHPVDLPLL